MRGIFGARALPAVTMFIRESFLPGISNQLALGGIVVAIALYTLYHVRPAIPFCLAQEC